MRQLVQAIRSIPGKCRALVALSLCLLCLPAARIEAQEMPSPQVLQVLRPEAASRLARTDSLVRFTTRPVERGRLDVKHGIRRADYRIRTELNLPSVPEQAARTYLMAEAETYGLLPDLDDLVLVSKIEGRQSTHLVFGQVLEGIPVYRRMVKVNLDASGRPTLVINGYDPDVASAAAGFDPGPTLSESQAVALVRAAFDRPAETGTPELVVYPESRPRLSWRVLAYPEGSAGELEVFIDARTGDLIRVSELGTHEKDGRANTTVSTPGGSERRVSPDGTSAETKQTPLMTTSGARVDGTGYVFDPDPLTTAGVTYGAPYVDSDDEDVAALNDQRKQVTLPGLSVGSDGLYRLQGPYVRIVGESSVGGNTYTPPAESSPDGFVYTRANDFFEAVMSYYHIDRSQRYVQELNLGFPIQESPLRVNPHGLGTQDDSKYYPGSNTIAFGTGGIDDAEDAFVIWHEYGHALLEGTSPGLRTDNPEGQALHEGWADYWAASFERDLIERGVVPARDWKQAFYWDGNLTWTGRYIDEDGVYPGDLECDDGTSCNIYLDGLFWATTLMEVYDALGRTVTDRLNLLSHAYLSPPVTFADAAEALLQADADEYEGVHVDQLVSILSARGLVDAGEYGPQITNVEAQVNGARIHFTAIVSEKVGPIAAVQLYYRTGSDWQGPVSFDPAGDQTYVLDLPRPEQPGLLRYYVVARDVGGHTVKSPASAPDQTLQLTIGTVFENNVFNVARTTNEWTRQGTGWRFYTIRDIGQSAASLVLTPIQLPANSETILLDVTHSYRFDAGAGGNVKISTDGGTTWVRLTPEGGYPSRMPDGEDVFSEGEAEEMTSTFNLTTFSGRQVWLRMDAGAVRSLETDEFWRIEGAKLYQATFDSSLVVERQTELYPNYPDPFNGTTTASYSIEVASWVYMDLYDVLGKRVAVLVEEWKDPGIYSLTIDGAALAAGMYFLQFRAGDRSYTEPLIVSR